MYGVFNVTATLKEEEQGNKTVDAALANGVEHFVYTSIDRGGPKSDNNPTSVPHFATKHTVELYLKEKAAGWKMNWTILRPTAFFDNLTPDFPGKGFAVMCQ